MLQAISTHRVLVAVVVAGLFAVAPQARADGTGGSDDAPISARGITQSVADAGYSQGDAPASHADGDSALVSPTIDVPRDGSDTLRAGATEVTIPAAAGDTAQRIDSNTVAYRDGAAATVVQPTADGDTQILRVTKDVQSAPEFVVDVASSGDLTINTDGGVDITRDGRLVGEIRPPRATLDGQPLATRFVIDGTQVKQVTDVPDGATGTVVLDHWFGSYLGCITGVGVPLGVAIVAVPYLTYETVWTWVTRWSVRYRPGGPPIVASIIRQYGRAVYNSCRRFMAS
jgi:hypothetical protein